MRFTKLLVATSIAALTAGAAHANPLAFEITNVDGIAGNGQEGAGSGSPVLLANETIDSTTFTDVQFEFRVSDANAPGGDPVDFTRAQNLDVNVMLLDGLVFGDGVNSDDIVSSPDSVLSGADLDLTDPGTPGTTTANWNISFVPGIAGASDYINIRIPVDVPADLCTAKSAAEYRVKVTIKLTDTQQVQKGGPVTSTLVKCTNSVDGVVTSDEAITDSLIALPDYTGFWIFDSLITEFVNSPVARLGWVNYELDENAVAFLGTGESTNVYMSDAMVAAVDFDVEFGEDLVGIADVDVREGNGSVFGAGSIGTGGQSSANAYSFSFPPDRTELLDGIQDPIVVTAAGGPDPIKEQSVAVTNSVVTYDYVTLVPTEQTADETLCSDGELDFLQRQGRRFGFFDWNNESAVTVNFYRFTGLPKDGQDVDVIIRWENARAGGNPAMMMGEFPYTIAGADLVAFNGNAVINTNDIAAAMPGLEVYDVQFLVKSESKDIDVDRLQYDTTSGGITNFGDGANFNYLASNINNDPVLDGDQILQSE